MTGGPRHAVLPGGRLHLHHGPIDLIIEARAAGAKFDPPAPPQQRRRGSRPMIAGTSNAWAFRVDVTVSNMTRSWWCVYRQGKQNDPWECEQRLAILD